MLVSSSDNFFSFSTNPVMHIKSSFLFILYPKFWAFHSGNFSSHGREQKNHCFCISIFFKTLLLGRDWHCKLFFHSEVFSFFGFCDNILLLLFLSLQERSLCIQSIKQARNLEPSSTSPRPAYTVGAEIKLHFPPYLPVPTPPPSHLLLDVFQRLLSHPHTSSFSSPMVFRWSISASFLLQTVASIYCLHIRLLEGGSSPCTDRWFPDPCAPASGVLDGTEPLLHSWWWPEWGSFVSHTSSFLTTLNLTNILPPVQP